MPQGNWISNGLERGGQEMEFEPANWKPLEIQIGQRCAEFMWMWRQNGLEYYKHIDTRRYLILDAEGRTYRRGDGDLVVVDFAEEFCRVAEAIDVCIVGRTDRNSRRRPDLSVRGCRWHHESARHSTGCDRCGVSLAATYQRGEENVDCRSGRES